MQGWQKFNTIIYLMLRLAYINVLWFFFTLVGLVFFGLVPATTALFAICRKLITDDDSFNIFPMYWSLFRKNFVKMNGYGIIISIIVYFLYFDFTFLHLNSGKLHLLFPVLIFILTSFIITMLVFFPVYVHFDLKFFQYFKQAFLIAILAPLRTLMIALVAVLIIGVAFILPGIIPLFPVSVFAYVSTLICRRTFLHVESKKIILAE